MDTAIGMIFFLLVVIAIAMLWYKNREDIQDWLERPGRTVLDPQLQTLQEESNRARKALNRYRTRLRLGQAIKDAEKDIEELDKLEEMVKK